MPKGFKHGMRYTREYSIWKNMKARCNTRSSSGYHNYGGRGIRVCERWNQFENFYKDMGPSNGKSIDRKENGGDYTPENCKWSTRKEQMLNTRRNNLIICNGETKTLHEWSEITGLDRETIRSRIRLGWTTEDALNKNTQGVRIRVLGKDFKSYNSAAVFFGRSKNWVKKRMEVRS